MQLSFAADLMAPASRRTDPITSKLAAESAKQLQQRHCALILEALRRHGPSGKDRLAAYTGLTGPQVARRTFELGEIGKIKLTGESVASNAGRPERVWRAV
jgi:predicted ArsR family transcriptional regulator